MILAFAPRLPWGCSWIIPAALTLALVARPAVGQAPPPDAAKPAPARGDAKPNEAGPAVDEPEAIGTKGEVFIDPMAKKTLAIFAPLNYVGPPIKVGNPPDDRGRVQNMAARNENEDPAFLKRYVDYFAAELSSRSNLNGLLNPGPNPKPNDPATRGLERAVDALTKPLVDSRAVNNPGFLANYSRILFESSLPKLLENNYLTRIDAMIVLGMAGSPAANALDLYIAQVKKPDQVIWVKLWAARGITNAAQQGRANLDAQKATQAAESLIGWLDADPKLPWPAQMRALEALGSLRFATNAPRGKVDAASTAMRFLADPATRPEVRAYAAWALGMMKVPQAVTSYNYALLGHEIGRLVVDIGGKIVEEYDDNAATFDKDKDQAAFLTGLLLFQAVPAISGEDGVSESGLLRAPGLGNAKPLLGKLEEKVKAATREAYELLRAGGNNQKDRRNDLDAKLADLKTFLASSQPKDRRLVPGGPEIPATAPKMAGAPGR